MAFPKWLPGLKSDAGKVDVCAEFIQFSRLKTDALFRWSHSLFAFKDKLKPTCHCRPSSDASYHKQKPKTQHRPHKAKSQKALDVCFLSHFNLQTFITAPVSDGDWNQNKTSLDQHIPFPFPWFQHHLKMLSPGCFHSSASLRSTATSSRKVKLKGEGNGSAVSENIWSSWRRSHVIFEYPNMLAFHQWGRKTFFITLSVVFSGVGID